MKFDARKAEHEYITDTKTSYRKLAEKYEVSFQTVKEYAVEHEWVKKRKEYSKKVSQKLLEKSIEQEVDKLARCKTATDTAIEVVEAMIDECKTGTPQDLRTCVAALKDLIGMQRDLHGVLSRKDELMLHQGDSTTDESGVVYIPPLAPEADAVVVEGDSDA